MEFTKVLEIYNNYRTHCHNSYTEPTIYLSDAAADPNGFEQQMAAWNQFNNVMNDIESNLNECPFCNQRKLSLKVEHGVFNTYRANLYCNVCDYTLSTLASTELKAVNKLVKIWNRQ